MINGLQNTKYHAWNWIKKLNFVCVRVCFWVIGMSKEEKETYVFGLSSDGRDGFGGFRKDGISVKSI